MVYIEFSSALCRRRIIIILQMGQSLTTLPADLKPHKKVISSMTTPVLLHPAHRANHKSGTEKLSLAQVPP